MSAPPPIHHRDTTDVDHHDAHIRALRAQLSELETRRQRAGRHTTAGQHWHTEILRVDAELRDYERQVDRHRRAETGYSDAGATLAFGTLLTGTCLIPAWVGWSAWWWAGVAAGMVVILLGIIGATLTAAESDPATHDRG